MSLFDSVKNLVQICQFFGLAPFSRNQNTSKWELNPGLQILSIIYMIFDGINLIIAIVFNDSFINYTNTKIHIILHSLFLILNQVHAMFALMETFIKREQNIKLLNAIEILDQLFKEHLNMHIDHTRLKRTCRHFFILWICEILGITFSQIFVYIQTENPFVPRYMLLYVPAYALCKLSYVYSMILVSLIDESLNVLNKYLKFITKKNGYYIREMVTYKNQRKRKRNNFVKEHKIEISPYTFLFLRSSYSKIWAATVQVRNLMYWSLPTGCANEFYILTFCSYLFFINLFRQTSTLAMYVLSLIGILSDLANILFIARICSKAAETVSGSKC